MSSYRFQLSDYHAVKNADVKINGITVISGLNGTGKTTIARWLYYVVDVLCNYESKVEQVAQIKFWNFIQKLSHAVMSFGDSSKNQAMTTILRDLRLTPKIFIPDMKEIVDRVISIISESLSESFANQPEQPSFRRYEEFFNIKYDTTDSIEELVLKVQQSIYTDYKNILEEVIDKTTYHTIENFKEKLIFQFDLDLDGPCNSVIEFSEDGVDLIGNNEFSFPLNLRNVIYVNTQNFGKSFSLFGDNDLEQMLSKKRDGEVSASANAIAKLISRLIHGEVKVKKRDSEVIFGSKHSFQFVEDSGLTYNLRGAATGVISFSYLLQLLKNGWIDENTLFIIDEPECHLHPQWIVEYAHMLVRINKYIGAKIVISSHNPDMVSAIQAISSHEGTLDNLNFYLAEPSTESEGQYEFRCLGTKYSEIFDAFNVSIDRINAFLPEE